jgi:hypothetical protein
MVAMTRQTGHTQHSGLPVAMVDPRPAAPIPRAASDTAVMAAATRRSALVPDPVASHGATLPPLSVSTRFLSSFNAVSMMIFSALRLNMPSMPIASSTSSVYVTVELPSPLSAIS